MKDPIPSWRLNRPWKKTLTGKTIKNIDISEGYIELCDGNGIYLGEIGGLFYLNEKPCGKCLIDHSDLLKDVKITYVTPRFPALEIGKPNYVTYNMASSVIFYSPIDRFTGEYYTLSFDLLKHPASAKIDYQGPNKSKNRKLKITTK